MIERANYYLQSRQIRAGREEMVVTLAAVTHAGLFGAAAREVTAPPAAPVLRS
jgi:hypothetical protein